VKGKTGKVWSGGKAPEEKRKKKNKSIAQGGKLAKWDGRKGKISNQTYERKRMGQECWWGATGDDRGGRASKCQLTSLKGDKRTSIEGTHRKGWVAAKGEWEKQTKPPCLQKTKKQTPPPNPRAEQHENVRHRAELGSGGIRNGRDAWDGSVLGACGVGQGKWGKEGKPNKGTSSKPGKVVSRSLPSK